MAADYRTIAESGCSEVVEKKSRFIGEAVRVSTLEEAEQYIAGVRKHYYDARHHCFAFLAGEPGTPEEIIRSGDDGEPQGTAGKPMLEILTGREMHQTLVVVTRYFGGTLLGTGGLVRAYSAAAKEALEAAKIVCVRRGTKAAISCTYPAYGKLQYMFAKDGVMIGDTEFAEGVRMEVTVPASKTEYLIKSVTEATEGKAEISIIGDVVFEEPDSL